jgi:hypothetical protein
MRSVPRRAVQWGLGGPHPSLRPTSDLAWFLVQIRSRVFPHQCFPQQSLMLAAWPWHWSASAWSALTFLVLAAAAVFAWFQVREAQRLRKEQTRPFVLVDFDAWSTIVEIRITNIGKTIARDVRFDFDPPLVSTHDNTATA